MRATAMGSYCARNIPVWTPAHHHSHHGRNREKSAIVKSAGTAVSYRFLPHRDYRHKPFAHWGGLIMSNAALNWAFNIRVGDQIPKLVLISLADNAGDETKQCFVSAAYIATRCEISERSVYRAVISLKDKGLISVAHRRFASGTKRTPIYTVHFPTEKPTATQSVPTAIAMAEPTDTVGGERVTLTTNPNRKNGEVLEGQVWIGRDSKEWKPWAEHWRKTKGLAPPTTTSKSELGWWFPTLAPPQ